MAANNTYTSPPAAHSKTKFWNKIKTGPKPKPRRTRHTSDSAIHLITSPSSSATLPTSLPHSAGPTTTHNTPHEHSAEPEIKYASEEMDLAQFASQYQNNLPQQVIVTDGVYWKEHTEVNISNSEKLNVYFVRHRESVKIREFGSKTEYSVPVTSTLEFGPVYNPYRGDVKDALRGFVYPTISDLLKAAKDATLPKLITAVSDSSTTTPGDCVTAGEMLVVKEIHTNSTSGYRQLRVFSLKTKMEKFLHKQCRGNFTTKPATNKLSLFSIIKYFPNSFPLCVKIFPGANLDFGDEHYPSHLFEKVIQICRTFTDVLLVASSVPHDSVCDGREPFEIPQEVELNLRVIELGENDLQKLKENGQQIMRNIQGDYIKQYRNAHQDMANYVVQDMFLKAVGSSEDNDMEEPHYVSPRRIECSAVEESSEPSTPQKDFPEEAEKKRDRIYPNVTLAHESVLSRVGKLEDDIWSLKKATSNIAEDKTVKQLKEVIEKLQKEVSSQRVRIQEAESGMRETKEEIQKMTRQLTALQAGVEGSAKQQPIENKMFNGDQNHLSSSLDSIIQKNKEIVSMLSAAQVLQLFSEIGIDDLELIRHEKITGDILVELNEDELESELGITRKIHRLKVMKVVNGSKPITDYISIPNTIMDSLC